MGEPAEVSQADRAETLALCKAIVESVRADGRMPLGLNESLVGDMMGGLASVFYRADVEQLAFRLAQLATLLAEQFAEVRDARDMACHLILDALDPELNSDKKKMREHVAALRKVGAL